MFHSLISVFRLAPSVAAAILVSVPISGSAATLTFPGPFADLELSGTTSEGVFSYNVFSGGIVRWAGPSGPSGNPLPHLEGETAKNGGVLTVFRNDVVGGLFVFDAADIAYGLATP